MRERVELVPNKLRGTVVVPPSKSISHRYIICAALADDISTISNIQLSDDIKATMTALNQLGVAEFEIMDAEDGKYFNLKVAPKNNWNVDTDIFCNESGSTLRFLIPICLAKKGCYTFLGEGKLLDRPLDSYINLFNSKGVKFTPKCTFDGALVAGEYELAGNISSQYISGLLFTLPLLDGNSRLVINTKVESKDYIDLTLDALDKFGIEIENINYTEYIIKGNQKYKAGNYVVESDFSQAAFFLCAAALGSDVICRGIDYSTSKQGDKVIIDIIERMKQGDKLVATDIDASQCPDLVPVLTVLCSLAKGTSRIYNAGRLRIKESDRLKSISCELNSIGGNIEERKDELIINGISEFRGGETSSWNDHRIAMSIAIAATVSSGNVIINNADSVKKSYPDFWDEYINLGGKIL